MKIAILIIDYIFLLFFIVVGFSTFLEGRDNEAVIGIAVIIIAFIPNIIYIHKTKSPEDLEKDSLKKEIEELKRAIKD